MSICMKINFTYLVVTHFYNRIFPARSQFCVCGGGTRVVWGGGGSMRSKKLGPLPRTGPGKRPLGPGSSFFLGKRSRKSAPSHYNMHIINALFFKKVQFLHFGPTPWKNIQMFWTSPPHQTKAGYGPVGEYKVPKGEPFKRICRNKLGYVVELLLFWNVSSA